MTAGGTSGVMAGVAAGVTADGAAGVTVVGLCVGLAVAVALWQGGRDARSVLGESGRAVRLPGGSVGGALTETGDTRTALTASVRAWRDKLTRPDRRVERVRVVVAQVCALLRAGAPPGAAWTRAAGVPVDGLGVPDLAALAVIVGADHARAVCAATRLALTVGAPLGAVLDTVSDALVAQAEATAEREAALAGPRTTARVLLWLPAAGALLGWAMGADPFAAAFDGGVGTAAAGGGLVLLAVGRWWTLRLVDAARRAGAAQ